MRLASLLLGSCLALTSLGAQPDTLRISLDGEWRFAADRARGGLDSGWQATGHDRSTWKRVQTPAFWESYPGMADYDGWGWFARSFRVPATDLPLSIVFSGVDDDAVVWVNGVDVGEHTGYSNPFSLDISRAVRPGDNTIVVLVKDNGGGGGLYRPVTIVPSARVEDVLRGPYAALPARTSAPWVRDAVIYSVYLRSFSPEGTFAGLRKRLPDLKAMGVTVLWLLPIHPVGVERRKGTLGSPYAVRDFYGINPEFGTMADFKDLLASVHGEGMKLIIDLVANHTSWDSKLLTEHPEWFTRDSAGAILPPNADWTDVADLDYSHAGLREYMSEMMCWWVRDVGIDGFRCDVAELVPTDFWNEARRKLDAIKPVMMLSEGSIPEHHVEAFDLTYSWNIYDVLGSLLKGKRAPEIIDAILRNETLQFPAGSLRMRFTTNHDKNAWDAPAVTKFGPDGLALGTVLVETLPGVPLVYTGEEVSNDRKLSLFEKVSVDWARPDSMRRLFTALHRARRDHPALVRGEMLRVRTDADERVYAFERRSGTDRVLVVLNFGAEPVTVGLTVEAPVRGSAARDAFSGSIVPWEAVRRISLPARGYRLLVF